MGHHAWRHPVRLTIRIKMVFLWLFVIFTISWRWYRFQTPVTTCHFRWGRGTLHLFVCWKALLLGSRKWVKSEKIFERLLYVFFWYSSSCQMINDVLSKQCLKRMEQTWTSLSRTMKSILSCITATRHWPNNPTQDFIIGAIGRAILQRVIVPPYNEERISSRVSRRKLRCLWYF